jgi:hypothetical protein
MIELMKWFDEYRITLDRLAADARVRQAESKADLDRMFEWREWFGFRPGWPARRAARIAATRTP